MKSKIWYLLVGFLLGIMAVSCDHTQQQGKKVSPTARFKMTTPVPEGIEVPDQLNSRIGTLKFFDGFPDDSTVEKLYNNLDFQRAVQAYLPGYPAASMSAIRNGFTVWGPANVTVLPPGYSGAIPGGYIVINSPTLEGLFFYRLFAVNGDFQPAIESMKKYARVYPLSQAGNPPSNDFIDLSGKIFCGVPPRDYKFWEYLNEVVQKEPSRSSKRIN
jgi:hypothetical protein